MVFPVWAAAATILAAGLLVLLICWWGARTITPQERERRRRLRVHARGRITDGLITDVEVIPAPSGDSSNVLHFSYTLNGVAYTAAQDITTLLARLDSDPDRIAGPASVKYLPDNPFNSIVICEQWSGISGVRYRA